MPTDYGPLVRDLRRENRELRAEVADLLPRMDADAMTIGNLVRENERLRAALDAVGPRLEAHHRAMAAGDLMPCAICGDDADDGAE